MHETALAIRQYVDNRRANATMVVAPELNIIFSIKETFPVGSKSKERHRMKRVSFRFVAEARPPGTFPAQGRVVS